MLTSPDGQPEKFTDIPDGGAWGPEICRIGKTFVFSASDVINGDEFWKITLSGSTSVNGSISSEYPVRVYPNPVQKSLNIDITDGIILPAEMKVYDNTGKCHMTKKLSEAQTKIDAEISALKPGIYFLTIRNGCRRYVQRITIVK